jgi:hypothetical protein
LKGAGLVAETQCSDAAGIVDREEDIDGGELGRGAGVARASGFLAAFGVVAEDDTAGPAIGLGVGDDRMEERTIRGFAVKLCAAYEREVGLKWEAARRR